MRAERHGYRGDCLQRQPQHQKTNDESPSPTHMISIAVASFTRNGGAPWHPQPTPEPPVAVLRSGRSCLAQSMRLLWTDDLIPSQLGPKVSIRGDRSDSIELPLPWRSRRREDVTMHLPRSTLELEHE
jgi:hypothetical protein